MSPSGLRAIPRSKGPCLPVENAFRDDAERPELESENEGSRKPSTEPPARKTNERLGGPW
eukprot:1721249-Lingulodinium_polyedra.AAC.1